MHFLVLSIICNILVSIWLKYINKDTKKSFSMLQVVSFNYLLGAILCYAIYQPDINNIYLASAKDWGIWAIMAILFPMIFLFYGKSIQHIGIAKTDIAQRMSLILTLLASYFYYNEAFSRYKWIGVGLGLVALVFILYKNNNKEVSNQKSIYSWAFPMIVFIGTGFINIFLKEIATFSKIDSNLSLLIMFVGAFIISQIIILIRGEKYSFITLAFGAVLGALNYGNVLTYTQTHKVLLDNPSIVFTIMNLGVIILGSIVGVLLYKEKLNRYNYIGLALAIIAIIFISYR